MKHVSMLVCACTCVFSFCIFQRQIISLLIPAVGMGHLVFFLFLTFLSSSFCLILSSLSFSFPLSSHPFHPPNYNPQRIWQTGSPEGSCLKNQVCVCVREPKCVSMFVPEFVHSSVNVSFVLNLLLSHLYDVRDELRYNWTLKRKSACKLKTVFCHCLLIFNKYP